MAYVPFDFRPGGMIEYDPAHPITPIRSSVSFDEWQGAWMYHSGLTPRTPRPTLVTPSVRWECAGIITVFIGLYALAYMAWGM